MREHYETFRAQVAEHRGGQGLPRFVERAFRDFLTCGCLAASFARSFDLHAAVAVRAGARERLERMCRISGHWNNIHRMVSELDWWKKYMRP